MVFHRFSTHFEVLLVSFFMIFRNRFSPRMCCAKPSNLMTLTVFWRVLAFRKHMQFQVFSLLLSTSISTSISRAPQSRFVFPFDTVWVYFWWSFFTPFSVGRFMMFFCFSGSKSGPKWAPGRAVSHPGLLFVSGIGLIVPPGWAKGRPKVPKVAKGCQKGSQMVPKGSQIEMSNSHLRTS